MPKGKSLNPADAYRKAQRKKELKKNKAERAKARDFALVKKDTRDLEDDIEKLEAAADLSASDTSRLTTLKAELAKIMEKKDEYVKDHPDQRRLVYRPRKQDGAQDHNAPPPVEQKRNLFDKHGLPRHPERSIYYDPIMNPYGVPPPGMPYIEKPLATGEADSDEDIICSDDDIVMPEGPPPGASIGDAESSSDDDIPMPEGPPPDTVPNQDNPLLLGAVSPPFPPPPLHMPLSIPSFILPPPPPPPGFSGGVYTNLLGGVPPPLPPPGFFPRRVQSTAAIQDPLSSIPHEPYQAHRASQLPLGHPSLPPKPPTVAPGDVPASLVHTGATVSAEPELRDLKKEATTFVPASLRRKKPSGAPSTSKVNAAPSVNAGLEAVSPQARPDLVGVLKTQLGTVAGPAPNSPAPDRGPKASGVKGKDDYQKFVDEMSDLLGSPGGS